MDGEATKQQTQSELLTFGRQRLSPGAYHLNLSTVENFVLKDNGRPSTFAAIYDKLSNAEIIELPSGYSMSEQKYLTDSGQVTISCDRDRSGKHWVMDILIKLIRLCKDGVKPELATWFYYDNDCSRDADEMFFFFVVCGNNIVRETFSVMHCDPRVLTKAKCVDDPIWHSSPYENEAWEIYFYRKFYTDTLTGQLLVLRPDEPLLYHYEREPANDSARYRALAHEFARDVEMVTLLKAYRLLWIAVALLAAIAFPALKLYLTIVAAFLAVELLWRMWLTRKVGQSD